VNLGDDGRRSNSTDATTFPSSSFAAAVLAAAGEAGAGAGRGGADQRRGGQAQLRDGAGRGGAGRGGADQRQGARAQLRDGRSARERKTLQTGRNGRLKPGRKNLVKKNG
jgi:hypothetical protein